MTTLLNHGIHGTHGMVFQKTHTFFHSVYSVVENRMRQLQNLPLLSLLGGSEFGRLGENFGSSKISMETFRLKALRGDGTQLVPFQGFPDFLGRTKTSK